MRSIGSKDDPLTIDGGNTCTTEYDYCRRENDEVVNGAKNLESSAEINCSIKNVLNR